MTGQKERHRFIPHLRVRHALAVFVFAEQQHREQIAPIFACRPPLIDEAVDDLVQRGIRPPRANPQRRRHPMRQQIGGVARLLHHFDRALDLVRRGRGIGIEERAPDDHQRQLHHLFADVKRLARAPAREPIERVTHHRVGVGADAHRMESRLHQTPLPLPEVAVARHQARAHEARQAAFGIGIIGSLDEDIRLPHQNLADHIRIRDEILMMLAHLVMDDIAVLRHPTGDARQRIFQEAAIAKVLLDGTAADIGRSRWKTILGHGCEASVWLIAMVESVFVAMFLKVRMPTLQA